MRITTWNVNSIRRRLDNVLDWIQREQPDVLCLQETKCTDDRFPWVVLKSLGYSVAIDGQRSYNGVAIASRGPLTEVTVRPVWPKDQDARSISCLVGSTRIVNVYVPYGEKVGTTKFSKKLRWLRRLRDYMVEQEPPTIVSGDFNVAPDDRDVFDPRARHEKLICSTPERERLQALIDAGYRDALRMVTDEGGHYTWWSHRVGAVERNRGLRIDHHLVSNDIAPRIRRVSIDVRERRRSGASDHAPVTLDIQLQ